VNLPTAFEEAYRAYLSAMEQALADPSLQARAADAYTDYMGVLQDVWTADAQARAGRATADYGRALQQGLRTADARRCAEQAYRAYVRSLKQAWAEVDPDAVDFGSLSAMSQGMMAVEWMLSLGLQDSADTSS
jgi:hypothetical protein